MALTFYTGSAGSGKTTMLLTELIRQSEAAKDRRFFLIVPEQYTMQTQRELVRLHPQKTVLNLEVISLNRLAYRVFSETGYHDTELLEEIGKSFILEKVALEIDSGLSFFKGYLKKPEYTAQMKAVISELMLYDVSPEDLFATVREGGRELPPMLRYKLSDIAAVYAEFRKKMEGSYMTAEDVPDVFCALAERSSIIRDSVMAFDGFTGFTPVQVRLIRTFLSIARDVYVTVTADPSASISGTQDKTELFAMSLETMRILTRSAEEAGVPVRESVKAFHGENTRFSASPELFHLEQNLFRRHPAVFRGGGESIRIFEAGSPRAEAEEIARTITRIIREEGLHYSDIAVAAGDLDVYGDYLKESLRAAGIPFFIDEKRSLLQNPFIEFIRASVQACAEDYSYETMFRLLKSPFSGIDREAADRLENYVLGFGIKGKKRWQKDFYSSYRGEDPAEVPELNDLRKRVCAMLQPLAEAFSKRGGTVREKSAALYEFISACGSYQKLKEMTEAFNAGGRPDLAREYSQVYPYVCGFLDKLVAVLGDERISMRDYAALLLAGFSEGRIAIIPPGSDRVLICDVERSRIPGVKTLIFAGMNEGMVPKTESSQGLLTDADRENLSKRDISLKPFGRTAVSIGRFYLYLMLSKPSSRLIMSYSRTLPGGGDAHPSYVIGEILRMFPDLRVKTLEKSPETLIECGGDVASYLSGILQGIPDNQPDGASREAFSYFLRHPDYALYAEKLLAAAGEIRGEDRISRAAASALYGNVLHNSASRLERFFECEFRHFLDYGLRLVPRPAYEFTGLDFGNIVHRSLELYAGAVSGNEDCPDEEFHLRLADEALLAAVSEVGGDSVIHSSKRSEYGITRIRRMLEASVKAQLLGTLAGDFRLYGAEADFRKTEDLKPLEFDLGDGKIMRLGGRIDRIDVCESGDVSYFRIIDYKTGDVSFDPAKIYYGLQLQLSIYMNAGKELLGREGRTAMPAGIFYYRVQDPLLPLKEGESLAELQRRRLDSTKADGVVLGDASVIAHFDRDLPLKKKSEFIPVEITSAGALSKRSKVIDEAGFHILGQYAGKMAASAGRAILAGNAALNPYRYRQETACSYCPYKEVCGFDEKIPGYSYRKLIDMNQDEALHRMQEDLDELDG